MLIIFRKCVCTFIDRIRIALIARVTLSSARALFFFFIKLLK